MNAVLYLYIHYLVNVWCRTQEKTMRKLIMTQYERQEISQFHFSYLLWDYTSLYLHSILWFFFLNNICTGTVICLFLYIHVLYKYFIILVLSNVFEIIRVSFHPGCHDRKFVYANAIAMREIDQPKYFTLNL